MNKPSYQELEERIRELENESSERKRIETELLEKQAILRKQNVNLVRKSIELSDIKRELEDKNYELELTRSEFQDQNVNLVRKSIELSDIMRQLEDKNYDLELSQADLEKTLAALQESEERYRQLVENANDIIFGTDDSGHFTFVNPIAERIVGYSEKEFIGKHHLDLIRPDYRQDAERFYRLQLVKKIQNTYHEFPAVTRDGTELWLGQNVQLVMEDDRVVGFQAVARDITERQRAQEALRRAHDELEKRVQERTAELAKANEALRAEITERKRAEEALKTFGRQHAALFQLSADLAITRDEADVCREVVRGLHDTLVYDCLGLFLLDEDTGERMLRASIGWPDAPSNWRIPPGHGLSERPLLDDQLHYTPDVTRDPCYVPGLNSGAEVDVPLRIGDKVLGVLVVESSQPNAFDQDDFAVLTVAANQASIAIERAREHQAVKEAEARYRSLFDGVPVGLYRSTPAGQFLEANPALVRMLGYPDSESLLAVNAVDVHLNAEECRQWQALVEREGVVRGWELQLRRRDGTVIWVEKNAQAVRDQDGRVLHYEGSLQDITERKRAEEALRKRTEEISLLYEVGRQFSRTLDLERIYDTLHYLVSSVMDCDGLFVSSYDCKDNLIRRTYARHERQRLDVSQFPPIPLEPEGRGIQSVVIRTGEPLLIRDYEARLKRTKTSYDEDEDRVVHEEIPDDADRTRSAIIVPLKLEGQVVGVVQVSSCEYDAYTEDDLRFLEALALQVAVASNNALLYQQAQHEIAERQRAEAALEKERALLARRVAERTAELSAANAELARAARLKDEFLASMSHELRTPLNAVLGLSEALQEQVYGSLNEKQLKSLRSIEESGRHLLALINDILDVSKIEAGKLEFEIGPVSVELVCQASLGLIKQDAHKKQLKISSIFESAVTTLQADKRRLKQILVNLLSNAVKFTPEGGAVGLEVVGDAEREVVHFTVWDTGIGISPEEIERLFQPFVQLDSSLSRQYTGTGLGLALVRRLTELHGGGVSVESEVGKGSRFTVSLPWREPVLSTSSGRGLSKACPEPSRRVEGLVEAVEPAESGTPGVPAIQRALIIEDSPAAAGQLTRYLSELGVETVIHPRGEGAVDEALKVHPDVVILDILLPDPSGWDVLAQLKAEPHMQDIPVLIVSVVDERSRGLALGASEYLVKPISRQQLQRALSQIVPQRVEEPTPLVATADQESEAERPLILLAEDNEESINTIQDYLLVKGYRVVVARDGAEAIERAREERPELIVMDIQMPGLDGLEATRRLRAEAAQSVATVPIIALTALAMPGDRERCLAAGANEYLSKPVSLKGLVQVIEVQLNRNQIGKGKLT
jgi:PAS domain S-box-containing protein